MQNQAVIDIETYYTLRVENEKLKHRASELEKGEILRLNDTIDKLKKGLIIVLTQGRGGMEVEPPYEVKAEGKQLVVTLKSNTIITEKFNDVYVKIR
jgi:hypothetical protein